MKIKFKSGMENSSQIKPRISIYTLLLIFLSLFLSWPFILNRIIYTPGNPTMWCCVSNSQPCSSSTQPKMLLQIRGKHQTNNFKSKLVHGNITRGIKNIHLNIRALYNKTSEIKKLVKEEKPHILGISETELRKTSHDLDKLKLPGYVLLLPKSWECSGKARIVVYVKKTLEYEQLLDLEHEEVQSIWIKAGFKSSNKIFYSHQYREHTNCMGSSLADQRVALKLQLRQWEDALVHGNPGVPNEVHVAGDMNLDSLKGRWLEPGYPLVTLARMVVDCCNANNFVQMVDNITRSQYNSVKNQVSISCIDHL